MKSNAALKFRVSALQIESLMAQRESLAALKKRFDLLENSVRASEQGIVAQLENGAEVEGGYELSIRTIERRSPSWKAIYSALAAHVPSAPTADEILSETPPTKTKVLVVK